MTTPTHDYRRLTPFSGIPVGEHFECNGNLWRKCSTRTAVAMWPAGPHQHFYFGRSDRCHVRANKSEGAER